MSPSNTPARLRFRSVPALGRMLLANIARRVRDSSAADPSPARCSSPSTRPATAASPFTCPATDESPRRHTTPSSSCPPCSPTSPACSSCAPRRPSSTAPLASPCTSHAMHPPASAPNPPVTRYRSPPGPALLLPPTSRRPVLATSIDGTSRTPPRYAHSNAPASSLSTSATTLSRQSTSTLTQFSSGCSTRATRPSPHSAACPAATPGFSPSAPVRTPLRVTTSSRATRVLPSSRSNCTSPYASLAAVALPSPSPSNPSHTTTGLLPLTLRPSLPAAASITLRPARFSARRTTSRAAAAPPSTATGALSPFGLGFAASAFQSTTYSGASTAPSIGSTQNLFLEN